MWNEDTKDQMKEQMIIDFSTAQVKNTQKVPANNTKEENRRKIELAKKYGKEEIEEFEKHTREYMEKISHLTIFRDLSHLVDEMFLQSFSDNFIGPILRGEEIPAIPRETYKEIRKQIFLSLIKERIEN